MCCDCFPSSLDSLSSCPIEPRIFSLELFIHLFPSCSSSSVAFFSHLHLSKALLVLVLSIVGGGRAG